MKDLIACCGLDCENCDARKATVNNDDALRKKTAKQWAEANDAKSSRMRLRPVAILRQNAWRQNSIRLWACLAYHGYQFCTSNRMVFAGA